MGQVFSVFGARSSSCVPDVLILFSYRFFLGFYTVSPLWVVSGLIVETGSTLLLCEPPRILYSLFSSSPFPFSAYPLSCINYPALFLPRLQSLIHLLKSILLTFRMISLIVPILFLLPISLMRLEILVYTSLPLPRLTGSLSPSAVLIVHCPPPPSAM
jgi:hypothetical protein